MAQTAFTDATTRAVLGIDAFLAGVEPASLAAKSVSLPFFGPQDRAAWEAEMACLKQTQDFQSRSSCEPVRRALGELPELERPLRRLEAGEALGDAELFELKRFGYFALAIFEHTSELLTRWEIPAGWGDDLRALLHRIHPEDEPSPRFFLSDRLDEGLSRVRAEERQVKKASSTEQRRIEKAVIDTHGGSFDLEGHYRPPKEGAADEATLIAAGLSRVGSQLTAASATLDSLRGELEAISAAVRVAESEVRARLSDGLRREVRWLKALRQVLVTLDVRLAKVRLFDALSGCWPELASSPGLVLEGARSPHINAPQPIDFAAGLEPTIVVGPNMGGKSSLLAIVGLAVYCAQHALPVPASRCLFNFVDAVVYVGADEPSARKQEEGLSSFGREVRRLVTWWKPQVSPRLWLLDEVGRGTHPEEGADIAAEVIAALFSRGDYVLAATHFPSVAAMAGARKLRIAGLVHRQALMAELAGLSDDPEALTSALRRAMDYRPIPTEDADIPRDARDIARALGLALNASST
jgi:DNA mismatch repair protein MutS2